MQSNTRFFPAFITATTLVLAGALPACTGPSPSASPSATTPAATDSLDFTMRSFIDQGATAVVVQVRWPGGEWSRAYGVRDLDTKTPAQPTDRVEVASLTKTMTAVTVLKLVDDGLIGLDDPVNDIIPGFTTVLKPPAPITTRQLLSHTSGMPAFNDAAFFNDIDFRPALAQHISPERALELAATLPWDANHVGSFSYSDSNYMALGLLVQTLRHKPFAQVLREEVIDRLGLKHTTTQKLDLREADLIHGYVTLRGERIDTTDNTSAVDSPAAGAVSTMVDLNDFFAALFQGKLISATSLDEMKKKPTLAPYALGVWTWPDGCTGGTRYEGRGGFWDYRTVVTASEDGTYEAAMTVVVPPLPTEMEDPDAGSKRELFHGQMESTLNETLDRLCQPPN
jgi:D-alanyl-D-alanine carboxypeptidase